jgi:hypothetical protein
MMHYPMDLIMSGGWFAAFALLVMYIHDIDCGGAFHWAGITHGGNCNQWKADEAFSFLSAIFWFCSALLVSFNKHRLRMAYSNSSSEHVGLPQENYQSFWVSVSSDMLSVNQFLMLN